MKVLFFFVLLSFLISSVCVWFVRELARKKGWLAPVTPERWHGKPTALYGGIGIFLAYVFTTLMAFSFYRSSTFDFLFIALIAGGLGSFLLGLFDDLYHFKPFTKLIGQIFVSTLFILAGGTLNAMSNPIGNVLLTYLWFVGIINAINLLDNMDALASGVVAISGTVLLIILVISGNTITSLPVLTTAVFVGAVFGFWVFNRYPATIFMGDCGSLFLGYTLAALTIPSSFSPFGSSPSFSSVLALLLPVTVLAVPIFDTTLVTFSRAFSGRSVIQGGKDHSSHRLVWLGFSERISVMILYLLTFLGGFIAIFMTVYPNVALILFGFYMVSLFIIGFYLGKKKIYFKDGSPTLRTGWTPIVAQIMGKKGMAEVILDTILVSIAYSSAIFLRGSNNGVLNHEFLGSTMPVVICITIGFYGLSGVYRGLWDLLSIDDIYPFSRATISATLATAVANIWLLESLLDWKFYFIFWLLLFFTLVSSRLSFRFFDNLVGNYGLSKRPVPVLLYGAGVAGKLLVDEIKRNKSYSDVSPVGFLDDDSWKRGCKVSGIKILGDLNVLELLLKARGNIFFNEIWLSSLHISNDKIKKLRSMVPQDVPIRIMRLEFAQLLPEHII